MDIFWIRVFLSFIIGGIYIALSLFMAERFGSRIGGLIVGLPSTSVVSLFFIGITQGIDTVASATTLMPLSLAAISIFIAVFFKLQNNGLYKALAISFLVWLGISLPLAIYHIENIWYSTLACLIIYLSVFFYFKQVPDRKSTKTSSTKIEFFTRAILSGFIIALAVVMSKYLGPLWGGLIATIPITTASSIFLLYHKQGAEFTGSVITSIQRALAPSIVFVLAAHFLVQAYGIISGLIFSYIIAVISAIVLYQFVLTSKNRIQT